MNYNVVRSHVLYNIKKEEDGTLRLKSRICLLGNRDMIKYYIRKDSATAPFSVIRLMLAVASIM